ncbi:unnamed protein product [Penicillium roqueforti FM164]|uniref:Genomic scaffold, ProqFM164S01 n=1 Tax=Penicillium roqueforti (strain FM164) TaxID=1365484 RepID=W6PXG4_PENRF|nr:unnamed protein product [Penicillium roqueforti FM164]
MDLVNHPLYRRTSATSNPRPPRRL